MRYEDTARGTFISRPNRFIAHVELDGEDVVCHVKNTGRCRELLVPGAPVVLCRGKNPARRTAWDLVTVYKGDMAVNIDSAAPNKIAAEYLPSFLSADSLRAEVTYGDSRLDFAFTRGETKGFVEVKGVTLEENGICRFPDAPTVRGTKHLRTLIRAHDEGFEAWALFVVQMSPMIRVEPNAATDSAFAEALSAARDAGVHISAVECAVTEDSVTAAGTLPVHII